MKYANVVAYVPAQTMADDKEGGGGEQSRTLLPMGSVFEGTSGGAIQGPAGASAQAGIFTSNYYFALLLFIFFIVYLLFFI